MGWRRGRVLNKDCLGVNFFYLVILSFWVNFIIYLLSRVWDVENRMVNRGILILVGKIV